MPNSIVPCMAFVTTNELNENEEIMIDYGDAYWEAKSQEKKRYPPPKPWPSRTRSGSIINDTM